ncbi:hypothetical protein FBU30_002962 [Linnemannia zychae]|nr:hypothetical protein FBU30_002962 [Linnemannia zychae]
MQPQSACDRFFEIPELIELVSYQYFWRSIDLEDDRLMRHLDEADWDDMITSTAAMQTHASNLSILKPPIWVPDAIIRDPPTRCLPPMTRLHQLDVCFDRNYHGILFENAMRLNQPVRLLRPIAWIMDLNRTGLTHVSLRHMEQPSPLELRCIARSLSRLGILQDYWGESWSIALR